MTAKGRAVVALRPVRRAERAAGIPGILDISNNTLKTRSRRLSRKLEANGCTGAAAEQEAHSI